MPDLKKIAALIGELENQTIVCMRCGLCQSVCPIFENTGREADVARGKLALLDGLAGGVLTKPQEVSERLHRCLLCGSCAANCPSGVNAFEIFLKARVILAEYKGLPVLKKLLLRKMLAYPKVFDRLLEWGETIQKLISGPTNDIVGTSCARVISPLIGKRHYVPLAPKPFHKTTPSLDTEKGNSGLKVAFFPGCLMDKIFPRIARDVVDVLTYHGIGIWMPPGQGCCGIPAISSGDTIAFEKLAIHNLQLLGARETDFVVTACATCTATIKKVWPAMLENLSGEYKTLLKTISEKTIDISELLIRHVSIQPPESKNSAPQTEVTYHDPCHLKKTLGIHREPRELIQACSGYRLVEMDGADKCCGMGGSFNLQHYEISCSIGERKKNSIVATGCRIAATGCPACMLQISDMLSQSDENIRVKHPIELYAEMIKKGPCEKEAHRGYRA